MNKRKEFLTSKTWVIKIGSSILSDKKGLNKEKIHQLVQQIAHLHEQGIKIIVVSSGAILEGMSRLGWRNRPKNLYALQTAAAMGQVGLVQAYESAFSKFNIKTAQVLLIHDDLNDNKRIFNIRSTLKSLWEHDVIPIINENDTVSTEEICIGDNDMLAAKVTNLIDANKLIILTDQNGLYDSDPHDKETHLISEINVNNSNLNKIAEETDGLTKKGGIVTKIEAAKIVAEFDIDTIIAHGDCKDILLKIHNGDNVGSLLYVE